MPTPPTPTYRVQRVNPRARIWRVLALVLLVVLAIAAGAAAGVWWARGQVRPASTDAVGLPPAAATTAAREHAQTIADLKRSQQVAQVAARNLRQTLAEREEEISALRADLAFYADLVGAGERSRQLTVHGVHLVPVPGSRAWNASITLTHSSRRGKDNEGTVKLAVEGVQGGKLSLLNWDELGTPDQAGGLSYAFKYFQQLQTTIMLPDGFRPNRLRVIVDPADGEPVTHSMRWSEATSDTEKVDVQ